LKNYTWPYEAKFADKKYSAKKAEQFFTKLASTGTLGGMIYSSLHGHALVHALGKAKGDFVAGNVLMTMHSPLFLSQTKRNAVSLMKRFSRRYRNRYAVTPRFAITAHPEVMKEGGRLARKNGSFIQTHLSETLREIEVVLAIFRQIKGFEKVKNYTDVYGKCGLLGPKTVMGHGIFLSRDEMKKLARTRTAIAHCPTSNAPVSEKGLGSGLFDFRAFERVGGKWALASDIGGGPYLSMFDVMRSFVEQNRKIKNHHATFVKALYRATLAGADVMKLGKTNGNLETKKWANFILVKAPAGFDKLNCEEILINVISPLRYKRFLYDRLLREIWFQGERISK
jgi:guanine deaminase